MHDDVCRDQDDLVTVEAIKALFGQLPPYNPSLMTGATALTPQEELVSNRMRIRAWSMVSSQASNLPCTQSDLPFCQPSDAHVYSGSEVVKLPLLSIQPSCLLQVCTVLLYQYSLHNAC